MLVKLSESNVVWDRRLVGWLNRNNSEDSLENLEFDGSEIPFPTTWGPAWNPVNNVICTIFHWWSPEVFHQQYQQVQYIFINIIFQSSLAQCSFNDPAAWLLDYHYFFNISGSPSYHGFMPHHMHCFWNGDRTFGSRSEESQEATTTNMAVSTKPLPLNFNLLFL